MDETELGQNADFLSIAVEEMDRGNYEVAQGFVEDVYSNLLDAMDEPNTE